MKSVVVAHIKIEEVERAPVSARPSVVCTAEGAPGRIGFVPYHAGEGRDD